MSKVNLHDQDWRDFQPFPDPDIDVAKIASALNISDSQKQTTTENAKEELVKVPAGKRRYVASGNSSKS
jgi:hypothetical protein